jgi:hypothetical protein
VRFAWRFPRQYGLRAATMRTFVSERKVFAFFLNNHHGDEIVSVCCKSKFGENVDRASSDPERFYLPAYIGHRGWFGLRLDRGAVN